MARARRGAAGANYWPGFVDALATLLLVIIFLLVVFVLAQVMLSQAITGKDAALDRLNRQVLELSELLDLERRANEELRGAADRLAVSLGEASSERDELALLLDRMTARAEALEQRAESAERALLDLESTTVADREAVTLQLRQLESLRRDIEALRQLRGELENEVARLAGALEESRGRAERGEAALAESRDRLLLLEERSQALTGELATARREAGALRDRSKELEARLADERERTLLAQREIEAKDVRLAELAASLAASEAAAEEERALSERRRSQVALLNLQVARLREELQRLNALLDAAEAKEAESQATIEQLGQRLNRALAAKVEELARYRSEFFGRLKEVLGERADISIVGDRFVFQSEVLFDSASDEIGVEGRRQLSRLAETVIELAGEIPTELNWVLRVDGHTDSRPIQTPRFRSNWELSTARAISVVRFLIEQGVPPERLAATGFADLQPLDRRPTEAGYRRNRRIELKLTER